MNAEIKQQLEKYLLANGMYDLIALSRDEHPDGKDDPFGLEATAAAFFGEKWEVVESDMMKAAREHNDAIIAAEESRIDEILAKPELTKSDWDNLEKLGAATIEFNDDSPDGYQPSYHRRLHYKYINRRKALLNRVAKPVIDTTPEEDLARLGL